ncbi:superoxide dismutase [Cu-Zn] 4A [Eurytemora carolleeae]|uniref:superoxide dismutase [Cu-Zn] 4A n=1 Tax=Eurytemora carolleeae TaxID=1294199 RepID=UPI000C768CEA|nr:superoxide dismutase [Cu-Zn] 4A [Eurytemora carolleeae]|eukprot:XP_023329249.1 superoxide dismutase [Cu-Zn] 4A-like [Eurytemora affinis]
MVKGENLGKVKREIRDWFYQFDQFNPSNQFSGFSERQSGPFQFAELGLFFGAVLVALVAANTATTLITAANNITATTPATRTSAQCVFVPGTGTSTTISGTILITQDASSGVASYNGSIAGLTPGSHGFHVHTAGALGNSCLDTGDHYNPLNTNHGSQVSAIRHIGDLGNIVADATGLATVNLKDGLAVLTGIYSIIGRSLVVHDGPDDFTGLSGNAGTRAGCCIITQI